MARCKNKILAYHVRSIQRADFEPEWPNDRNFQIDYDAPSHWAMQCLGTRPADSYLPSIDFILEAKLPTFESRCSMLTLDHCRVKFEQAAYWGSQTFRERDEHLRMSVHGL